MAELCPQAQHVEAGYPRGGKESLRQDRGIEPLCLAWAGVVPGSPASPTCVLHYALCDLDKCTTSLSLGFLICSYLLTFPVSSMTQRP